jgi:RNA polymerase sigma-70 factor (ECF subfamily)
VLSLNPVFVVEIETPDTRSLLERARAGEAEAFGRLCRSLETRLLRQAMTLCRNATAAEDLTQDTLVEGWKCLHRYNGRCQFFTWLCAILLNRYRNMVREKRPMPLSSFGSQGEAEIQGRINNLADRDCLPDQAAELREQAELVLRCLKSLPAKHQQVIYMRFYVDDSLEGIAEALNCSVGTVKSRLFHALDKLRGMQTLSAHVSEMRTTIESL